MFKNTKSKWPLIIFLSLGLVFFLSLQPAKAQEATSTATIDSDHDGYSDQEEINHNYSPYNNKPVKLDQNDADNDGLSDALELKFKTDPLNPDTDGDGYKDGEEVSWGYNPLSSSRKKLVQKIMVNLKKQKLDYLVSGIVIKEFTISSGKASMPTPKGTFKIINKSKKAWSNEFKLWMPYWLGLDHGEFGIHELPIWPNGYREGANHLGVPVSHGCIRLGIGAAQYIYERVATGTEVVIN